MMTGTPPIDAHAVALHAAINAARAHRGRPPVAIDGELCEAAHAWAAHMASTDGLSHGDFAGRIWAVHPGTRIGEDVAMGQATPVAAVDAWLADALYRAILLGDFARVGCGVARDADQVRFYVADFSP